MEGHGHGHDHGAAARAGARHQGRLGAALALTLAFLVVQVVVGLATGSLALLSDAGHMATDALGLTMALLAIHVANRGGRDRQRTFGLYRLEILAALANAVLLFGVAGYVLVEAARRLSDPPDIASGSCSSSASSASPSTWRSFALLRSGAQESLNVEGAYLEVHGRHARLDRRHRGRRRDGRHRLGLGRPGRSAPPSACSSSPGRGASAARPCGSSCRRRRRARTSVRSTPTCGPSPASSTCTTSTCGR